MTRSTPYTTRVQSAVPPEIDPDLQKLFRKQPCFQVVKPNIENGNEVILAVEENRPDVLILDMTLPDLDGELVLTTLSSTKISRYVLLTAPLYEPHLRDAQRFKAVKGALPRPLLLSPLLRHVLLGIATSRDYFVPAPPLDQPRSGLTKEDTILLSLMAVGLEPNELAEDLGCSVHVVYTSQSQLRRKLKVHTNEKAILTGVGTGLVGIFTDQRAA